MPYGKIGRRVILAIVLAAIWIPEAQSQQPINQSTYSAQITESQQENAGQSVPIIISPSQIIFPSRQSYKIPPDEADTGDDKADSDWWMVKLTGVLALIGLLQLFVFGKQATRLRETVEEMEKGTGATLKVADAAKESADAAMISVKALQRLERAYLFLNMDSDQDAIFDSCFHQIDVGNTQNGQQQPWVRFSFINVGRTPAIINSVSGTIDLTMRENLESEIRYLDWAPIRVEKILPKDDSTTLMTRKLIAPILSKNTLAEIRKANMWLRFYGVINYEDVFGEAHETRFFWVYNGLAKTFAPHNVEGKNYNRRT